MKVLHASLVAALLASPGIAFAEGWYGDAALGVLLTEGNTDSRSINAKLALNYQQERWLNSALASMINTATGGETTTELYKFSDKLDYTFSERSFAFGALEFERDEVGGFQTRISETVGYGYRILLGPAHKWNFEAGAGARQLQEKTTEIKSSEAVARAGTDYRWTISDTSSFSEVLKTESGDSNTFTESVTELKLAVKTPIYVGISYTWRHNSNPPAGTEQVDTYTAINLSYQFGASGG